MSITWPEFRQMINDITELEDTDQIIDILKPKDDESKVWIHIHYLRSSEKKTYDTPSVFEP